MICSVLQDLALTQLMQKQLLPYLRAGAAEVPVAVDRATRVLSAVSRVEGLTQGNVRLPYQHLTCAPDCATGRSCLRYQASNWPLANRLVLMLPCKCRCNCRARLCCCQSLLTTSVVCHPCFMFYRPIRLCCINYKDGAAGSAKALEPFAEFLSAMARALEAQQHRSTAKHVQLAKQLARLLTIVGSTGRSQELLAAFPG